jgi:uncharacterized protein (TIGR02452 family)
MNQQLPMCNYGSQCYRQNPEHLKSYWHPIGRVPQSSPLQQTRQPFGQAAAFSETLNPFFQPLSFLSHALNVQLPVVECARGPPLLYSAASPAPRQQHSQQIVPQRFQQHVQPQFSALNWLSKFKIASQSPSLSDSDRRTQLRDLRSQIGQGTRDFVAQGCYKTSTGFSVQIPSAVKSTIFQFPPRDLDSSSASGRKELSFPVEVADEDCLLVAKRLISSCEPGQTPLVLNMACHSSPGGGFLSGAGAQEENLCRRSNYYASLCNVRYPLARHCAVFTKQVLIFRDTEAAGYALLDQPFSVNMLAVSANHRKYAANPLQLSQAERTQMAQTVRALLLAAQAENQKVLVLGALGCGAFNNPPAEVAAVFHEVLAEKRFSKAFSHVVFAILDDHNTGRAHNPEGNLIPFQREFHGHMLKQANPQFATTAQFPSNFAASSQTFPSSASAQSFPSSKSFSSVSSHGQQKH